MEIMKFGGAVLKDKRGFEKMKSILNGYSGQPCVVIVSAFSKTTRQLRDAAYLAEDGETDKAYSIIAEISSATTSLAKEIISDKEQIRELFAVIEESVNRIRSLLASISITGDLSGRVLDLIMSYGEFFALNISSFYLASAGLDVVRADSVELIRTNSDFGRAIPDIDKTYANIREFMLPRLDAGKIIVMQGFVASDENNDITTMGIESSNLTATLIAGAMEAEKITIWSDTPGFRTADPNIVKGTSLIESMSFGEAFHASLCGLKLIYPSMIEYAGKQGISLVYRSAYHPGGGRSIISPKSKSSLAPYMLMTEKMDFLEIHANNNKEGSQTDLEKFIERAAPIAGYLEKRNEIISLCTSRHNTKHLKSSTLTIKKQAEVNIITIVNANRSLGREILDFIVINPGGTKFGIISFGMTAGELQIICEARHSSSLLRQLHGIVSKSIQ